VSVSPIIHLRERSSLCGLARKKDVAKYKKKRARELQHDKFRDTANTIFDRLGERLEGKGKAIVYGLVGLLLLAVIVGLWLRWSNRKADEARRALGRAIAIATAPVSTTTPAVEPSGPVFTSEQERAQRAVDEFQKVAAKYGDPYRTEARYFIATNLLYIDRDKAMNELSELTKSNLPEVATLSKFSLAQAKEAEGKLDEAARLYTELASQNSTVVTPETANLQLAEVYEKQGKKKEAADLLFNIVDAARNAKDKDGIPLPQSAAAAAAAEKLQKLDPDRYAKVAPPSPVGNSPF
jgi:predicted negative regulator of RcsB-dependent stress response